MGKMNICVLEVVAWACGLLTIMFEAQLCICEFASTSSLTPRAIADNQSLSRSLNIEKIKFSTVEVTRESYTRFMLDLFYVLTADADRTTARIPILPQLPMDESRSYVHVEISNEEFTITFSIYITNVYVVGYQVGTTANYFESYRDDDVRNAAFPNVTDRETLPFDGDYVSLGGRNNVPLGFQRLSDAISTLHNNPPTGSSAQTRPVRRALVVVIQMISEASRFTNHRLLILNTVPYGEYTPDDLIQEYQNSWGRISAGVQTADVENFDAIPLTYHSQQVILQTVSQVIPIITLLLSVCNRQQRQTGVMLPTPLMDHQSSSVLPIRSTLEDDNVGVKGDDECKQTVDPMVRISGFNGLCLASERRPFFHGVYLQECNEDKDEQLWTFRTSDQTIRSGGRCLVTDGDKDGSPVLIFDCNQIDHEWEYWNDDNIILANSLLSLTAVRDRTNDTKYSLIVQDLYNASRQAWHASNITKPSVKSIVAYNGLCLIPSDRSVWLEECKHNVVQEKWAFFPDRSIRPQSNRQNCLKVIYRREEERIIIDSCDGEAYERWLFQSDSTIYHMRSQMVLQVGRSSGDNIVQVEVNKHKNNEPRQIWFQVD